MNSEIHSSPMMPQDGRHVETLSGTSNGQPAEAKHLGLAEIFADPSVIETLTAEAVASARGELARLDSLLLARLMNASGALSPSPPTDRRLNVKEAAAKLGTSKDWLYRHAGTLPFTVRIGRGVGFSEAGIERYLRQRAGR
jgi:predicted DNA-binding transcriptional regulator AlpA